MQGAIKTGRTEYDLIRTFLGVVDQLLECLVGLLIVDHEHQRAFGETRNRDEIGASKLGRAPERLVHRLKARHRWQVSEQCVAVRLGAGGYLRADLAGSARLGLDHDRVFEQWRGYGCEGTCNRGDSGTRGEWVGYGNRMGRIGVLRKTWPDGESR